MDSLQERINVIRNLIDEREFISKRITLSIAKLHKEGMPLRDLVSIDRCSVIKLLQDKYDMTATEAYKKTKELLVGD